eukprot:g10489.t1
MIGPLGRKGSKKCFWLKLEEDTKKRRRGKVSSSGDTCFTLVLQQHRVRYLFDVSRTHDENTFQHLSTGHWHLMVASANETQVDCGGPLCPPCLEPLLFDDAEDQDSDLWMPEGEGPLWQLVHRSSNAVVAALSPAISNASWYSREVQGIPTSMSLLLKQPITSPVSSISFLQRSRMSSLPGDFGALEMQVGSGEWEMLWSLSGNTDWTTRTTTWDDAFLASNGSVLPVRFRFRLRHSAGNPVVDGWYVDNIRVTGACPARQALNLARTACITCAEGTVSPPTSGTCKLCEAREAPNADGSACVACQPNQRKQNNQCVACPAGQVAHPNGLTCITPTCSDGFKNGNETAVDCGGPQCNACIVYQVLLFDDVEPVNGSYRTVLTNEWLSGAVTNNNEWVRHQQNAYSPTHSWFAFNKAQDSSVGLKTPLLTNVVQLQFWTLYNVENIYDGMFIEYRREDSDVWTRYSQQKVTGSTNGAWVKLLYNFGDRIHPGVKYQFRFNMVTDRDTGREGIWLDDIQFIAGGCPAGTGAGVLPNNGTLPGAPLDSCRRCDANLYSPAGSLHCMECPGRAEVPNQDKSACVPCPRNTVINETRRGTCSPCRFPGMEADPTSSFCVFPTCRDGWLNGREMETDCLAVANSSLPDCPVCMAPAFLDDFNTFVMEDEWVIESEPSSGKQWTRVQDAQARSGTGIVQVLPGTAASVESILELQPVIEYASRLSFWTRFNLQICCSRGYIEYADEASKSNWKSAHALLDTPMYRYYMWVITNTQVPDKPWLKIGELKLYNQGQQLNLQALVGNNITGSAPQTANANKEDKLIDGNEATQWRPAFSGGRVWVKLQFNRPVEVQEYEWFTGTGAFDMTDNDPAEWKWLGSGDGVRWEELSRTLAPVARTPQRSFSTGRTPINPYISGRSDGWEHMDLDLTRLPVNERIYVRFRLHHDVAAAEFDSTMANSEWAVDDVRLFGGCGAGLYLAPAGTACLPCPLGHVSRAGAPMCTVCNAMDGFVPNRARDACDRCGPAQYVTEDSNCAECPTGTVRISTGECGPNMCAMNFCSAQSTCENIPTAPHYNCTCIRGYQGTGLVCNDINECLSNIRPCAGNATCNNLPGSFSCACLPGFWGDGLVCLPPSCSNGLKDVGIEDGVDCGAACGVSCAGVALYDDAEMEGMVTWIQWWDPAGDQLAWSRTTQSRWSLSRSWNVPNPSPRAAAALISNPLQNIQGVSFMHTYEMDADSGKLSVDYQAVAEDAWITLRSFEGSQGSWQRVFIPTDFSKQNPDKQYRFRFQLASSTSPASSGWFLDDIRFFSGGCALAGYGGNGNGHGKCPSCPAGFVSPAGELDCAPCDAESGKVPDSTRATCAQCSPLQYVAQVNVTVNPAGYVCMNCPEGKGASEDWSTCEPYSCDDGKQNGRETSPDCGGTDCHACLPALFEDDFEAGFPGLWQLEVTSSPPAGRLPAEGWVLSDTRFNSPSHAAYAVNSPYESKFKMTTPWLKGAHRLMFSHWIKAEPNTFFGSCYDWGVIRIQQEGENSWTTIVDKQCRVMGPADKPFVSVSIDLTAFAPVFPPEDEERLIEDAIGYRFRFEFESDYSMGVESGYEGWYVDDVRFIGGFCGSGLEVNGLGTSCRNCPAGKYAEDSDQICQRCLAGQVLRADQSGCDPCPGNSLLLNETCVPCPAGMFPNYRLQECELPSCIDGYQNGLEEGPDCGGPACPACVDFLYWQDFDKTYSEAQFQAMKDSLGASFNTWSIVHDEYYSYTRSAFVPNVDRASEAVLTLPAVTGAIRLSFWHRYKTEMGWNGERYDGGWVEYSKEGEADPKAVYIGWTSLKAQMYSGDSLGWVKETFDLSVIFEPNTSYVIRFRMHTDTTVGALGWWLDDILLQGRPCGAGQRLADNGYSCVPCPPDQISPEGVDHCYVCPVQGQFPNANQSACVQCGLNEVSNMTAGRCQRCPAGLEPNHPWRTACITQSCFDGAQSGLEEGIDCGGSCAPCVTALFHTDAEEEEDVLIPAGGPPHGGWVRLSGGGNRSYHSPSRSWFIPDLGNAGGYSATLMVPGTFVNVSSISFWTRYNTEVLRSPVDGRVTMYHDYGLVEVSNNLDGYSRWTAVNEAKIGGTSDWTELSFWLDDLPARAEAGQAIFYKLRLRFVEDYTVGATGWWVDDMTIRAACPKGQGLNPSHTVCHPCPAGLVSSGRRHVCVPCSAAQGLVPDQEQGSCVACPRANMIVRDFQCQDCPTGMEVNPANRSECVTPRCDDKRKNGQEEDIDCGGPCAPCLPNAFPNNDRANVWELVQQWVRSTATFHSGTDCWFAAEPTQIAAKAVLQTPYLQGVTRLSFWHSFQLGAGAEAYIEYRAQANGRRRLSQSGGTTSWQHFGRLCATDVTYNGISDGWQQEYLDLSQVLYTDTAYSFRFVVDKQTAAPARAGWWIDDISFTGGACPAGQGLRADGGTGCFDCPAGTYSDGNAHECEPCPAGSIPAADVRSSCVSCLSDQIATADFRCQTCPPNTGPDAFKAACVVPSCTDGLLNGDEEGVDCGGSCELVCPMTVLSLSPGKPGFSSWAELNSKGWTGVASDLRPRGFQASNFSLDTTTYHSPYASLFVPDSCFESDVSLVSPPLEFHAPGAISQIQFWTKVESEQPADYGLVEWAVAGTDPSLTTGGLWTAVNPVRIQGRRGWALTVYQLAANSKPTGWQMGQGVQIRFRFHADLGVGEPEYAGWWVDDIAVLGSDCPTHYFFRDSSSSGPGGCFHCEINEVSPGGNRTTAVCRACPAGQYANQLGTECTTTPPELPSPTSSPSLTASPSPSASKSLSASTSRSPSISPSTNPKGSLAPCPTGYQINPADGLSCIDIDECASQRCSGVVGYCRNTPGSYVCTCNPGWAEKDKALCGEECSTLNCGEKNSAGSCSLTPASLTQPPMARCVCSNGNYGRGCAKESSQSCPAPFLVQWQQEFTNSDNGTWSCSLPQPRDGRCPAPLLLEQGACTMPPPNTASSANACPEPMQFVDGKCETPKPRTTVLYSMATCSDGVKNGAETGVDCGGDCGSCGIASAWAIALVVIASLVLVVLLMCCIKRARNKRQRVLHAPLREEAEEVGDHPMVTTDDHGERLNVPSRRNTHIQDQGSMEMVVNDPSHVGELDGSVEYEATAVEPGAGVPQPVQEMMGHTEGSNPFEPDDDHSRPMFRSAGADNVADVSPDRAMFHGRGEGAMFRTEGEASHSIQPTPERVNFQR